MDETRQQEYFGLVQRLLQCEGGKEAEILQAQPDLVDEGLVMMLLKVAQMTAEENDHEQESTIQWLNNFADQLAQELGLDPDVNSDEIEPQFNFLMSVLQAIADSTGNPQVIYPLFQANLPLLNEELIPILKTWHQTQFTEADEDRKQFIAAVTVTFANLIQKFPLGDRSVNLEVAIGCYDLALEVYIREAFPEDWAMTQYNLAIACKSRIKGERAENLEDAIECYRLALEIYTHAAFPEQWAMTQMNLANAYKSRIKGERAGNLEESIECYRLALGIYTRAAFPEDWATTQMSLADACRERIRGERAQNLEESIECYRLALEIYTRADYPEEWAMTQMNLAVAYWNRIWGERAQNLEESIECCHLALEIHTRAAFPEDWAMTQMNLAVAYWNRIWGERAQNLEESIACYRLALEVFTCEAYPEQWAATQMNLANAYRDRIQGERVENLEQSLVCCQLALEIYTHDVYPKQWALTQMNLGNAYRDRLWGERAQNLEKSITCSQLALKVYTQEAYPEQWAMTQMNLSINYSNRIRGERAANLEQSIECCHLALEIYTRKAFPEDWGMTQGILAGTYNDRIRGERAQNLEESITYYQLALEVYTRAAYPEQWARTQMNLAIACSNRIRGERAQNLEESITCSRLALEVYTRDAYPQDWATAKMNLAGTYINRIQGERAQNIEESIECSRLALEIYTRDAYLERWAMAQNNLAHAYIERIDGERTMNLVIAVECFKSALKVRTPELLPLDCLNTASNLGNLYFKQGNCQLATGAYELAMRSVETSRSWATSDASRQELLRKSLPVYENALQSAVNIGNYKLAIQYTERVRSRQLVELMASKDLYNNAQIPEEIQQYLREYETLNHQIQALRERPNDSDSTKGQASQTAHRFSRDDLEVITKDIQALEAEKQIIYTKIRAKDPVFAGQIEVKPIEWAQIQSLITSTKTAILTYYSTDDDTQIFIIKQGQAPELFTCTGQGYHELQNWLFEQWVVPYHNDNLSWHQQLPALLSNITQRLQLRDLVTQHLNGIEELIILPHLYLHQIPFAALPLTAEAKGEVLGDKFVIRSIPSCQILKYCVDRAPIKTQTYGTVEDADGTLLGARYECGEIANIHEIPDANRLQGKTQATIANYLELLTRINRLHSSHHAASRPGNPLESALLLADGKITLGDLLLGPRYPDLDEVFLSCCETHVGDTTITDDIATLNTGFLCIGARSVQGTLWSVSDIVTALFDIFYHEHRRDGMNRALALKKAQVRLRFLSGDEFKLNYYQDLQKYFAEHLTSYLEQLELQIDTLNAQTDTVTEEEGTKILAEIAQLQASCDRASATTEMLDDYCEKSRPFGHPYYWAAFISQGMA